MAAGSKRAPNQLRNHSPSRRAAPSRELFSRLKYILIDVQSGAHSFDHLASNIRCQSRRCVLELESRLALSPFRRQIGASLRNSVDLRRFDREGPDKGYVKEPVDSLRKNRPLRCDHGDADVVDGEIAVNAVAPQSATTLNSSSFSAFAGDYSMHDPARLQTATPLRPSRRSLRSYPLVR